MEYPLDQLGNRRDVRHPPTPGLHAERQFEAVGPQSALVDYGEVSANGAGKSGNYTVGETCPSIKVMIQHLSDLRECLLCRACLLENGVPFEV
jgi:hypothetical protein